MRKGAIVVGAGPVGLMLAGELHLGGADVVVYEKLNAPSGESRGAGFTRRTAEVFDQRGLLDRFGGLEPAMTHFGGVRFNLSGLDEDYESVRGIPQSKTEEILTDWLGELDVPIHRGHTVTGFQETPNGVEVTFDGPHGPGRDEAEYLVGCDGGSSIIRTLAGIDFPGWEATRGFYAADIAGVETRRRRIGERVPGGMVMAMDLQEGVTRIVVHVDGLSPRDKATLTFTEIADAWQRLTGESIHHAEVRWVSAFTDAAKVATEYRRGRVFLAGDATHVQIPAQAQGLGVGVQDAVNLGWKLAAAISGWAPDGLLDSYHTERHPVGKQLVRNAQASGLLYLSGEEMQPLRDVMGELAAMQGVAKHLAGMVSGLGIQYDMDPGDHPLLGLRMPPGAQLELPDGTRTSVATLLHPARGVLISTTGTGEPERLAAGWADRIDIVTGRWAQAPAAGPLDTVLIRPDGYVAWAAPGGNGLTDAIGRWFGAPHEAAMPVEPATAA